MPKNRVLLVEDDETLRASIAVFLKKNGFEVGEAQDEDTAMAALKEANYRLVITDLFLADGSGFGIMKHLQENSPETKSIVITGHASLDSAIRALRKGAFDYLLKPFELDELKEAVDRAVKKQADEKHIRKLDYQKIVKKYGLTRKELDITKIVITEGISNEEMAEKLNISKNTVKVHLRNIFKKTGVESKTALTTMLLSGGGNSK